MAYSSYKKAYTFAEIDNAVRFDVPIDAKHEFYTDFADIRGDFEEKALYRALNVDAKTLHCNVEANADNKTLLFLAGMRGSGKTSELAKVAQKIAHPKGFLPVICNLDDGLDLNDMEYMDILIFQLERLFEELENRCLQPDIAIITTLQDWFSERVKEANKVIHKEGGFEVELGGTPGLLSFLGLTAKVKGNLSGSKENATKIRTVFKNNFADFAHKFNEFAEAVNMLLRHEDIAREILFIVDGLEKTGSLEIRKKIIFEESNRIRQIKVNTIFTLPIELMAEKQKLDSFSKVISFPCVKLREKDGTVVEKAVARFIDFTYKRIDRKLFDSEETVRRAILMGGGSPREYMRLLEYAYMYGDEEKAIIDAATLDKAISKLSAQTAQYISKEHLEVLKTLKEANDKNIPIPYGIQWQELLEKLIVLEYNDGSYKRVNPIVEASELYKYYVGS
jgi:hypothetical protein